VLICGKYFAGAVVQEIPIFTIKGQVKILWMMFNSFLVKEVAGGGNSKLEHHL
jgi:hypothetical protein